MFVTAHPRAISPEPLRIHACGVTGPLHGVLVVEVVVAWAASPPPPGPHVIHINLRSPTRNAYFGGKAWSINLWRALHQDVPSVRMMRLHPTLDTDDNLLGPMQSNPVGKSKDAHVQVYPTHDLVEPPAPHSVIW